MNTFNLHIHVPGDSFEIRGNLFYYYADPFILTRNSNEIILLVERYSRFKRLGSIVQLTLNLDKRTIEKKPLITSRKHRSYPFPIQINGCRYIFVESISTGSLEVYSYYENTQASNLLQKISGHYVDPTISKENNRYYLYYYSGISNNDGNCFRREIEFNGHNFQFISNAEYYCKHRPGGLIAGYPIFQSSSGHYGNGLEWSLMSSLQHDSIEQLIPDMSILRNTHHIHMLNDCVVFDQIRKLNNLSGTFQP